jgi:hypothetical protein
MVFFGFSCSIDTFKDFSVVSLSIPKNGVIGTGKQPIEVVFSKRVNKNSADSSIHVEKDSSGEINFVLKVYGKKVQLTPEEDWVPHERFWLVINKDIADEYGKNMGKDFYFPFQSTGELMPVSAALVLPEIDNGIVSTETEFIEIVFSSGVNSSSLEREFSFSPSVDGFFEWTTSSILRFHFFDKLKKNTLYSVRITDNAMDEDGYKIRSYDTKFEYFPNQSYPEIKEIVCDLNTIFNKEDPATFEIEDGNIIIECPDASKNPVLRVVFSDGSGEGLPASAAPVDRTVFKENIQIFPDTGWREYWYDDYTVEISFEDALMLAENYEIAVNRGLKNTDGLSLLYRYLIDLQIKGEDSLPLELYADEFTALEIEAEALRDTEVIPDIVTILDKNENGGGYTVNVTGPGLDLQENIEINLEITLRFFYVENENAGIIPIIDKLSLQDSIALSYILGTGSSTAKISFFEWITDGNGEETGNECLVFITGAADEDIYCFSINGGRDGVVDAENNYMKEDIEYFFKVKLTPPALL